MTYAVKQRVADAIRKSIRTTAGIPEGQKFQADWEAAAEAAMKAFLRKGSAQ